MSRNVINNKFLLKALAVLKPEKPIAILKSADREIIQSISECVYNLIIGNVPLDNCLRNKLAEYKKSLRIVANKKSSLQVKKKALLQKGGVLLPMILAPILSGVLSYIFRSGQILLYNESCIKDGSGTFRCSA